jgi:hypothetical protein
MVSDTQMLEVSLVSPRLAYQMDVLARAVSLFLVKLIILVVL